MDYPEEWDQLPKRERKKLIKNMNRGKNKNSDLVNKLRKWGIIVVVVVLVVTGGFFWWTNREVLPPTSSQGHVEESPSSHILDKPMRITIQMHMLEHADGSGPPGVIINYNCKDFKCENDLIDKLAEIASQYPEFVYVAPYPSMTQKIVITREGEIEKFDNFDEKSLISFIEGK